MIASEEFNKIPAWFGDDKNMKKLSTLEFSQYMSAAMEFVEKLKPIYYAHNKDSYEWIMRNLFKEESEEQ